MKHVLPTAFVLPQGSTNANGGTKGMRSPGHRDGEAIYTNGLKH